MVNGRAQSGPRGRSNFMLSQGYIRYIYSLSDQPSGLRRGFVFSGQASHARPYRLSQRVQAMMAATTPGACLPARQAATPTRAPYANVPGFCKAATLDDIRKHGHVLTPGRYVGAEAAEDDGEPFEEKMRWLVTALREQQAEAAKLDNQIWDGLTSLGLK